MVRYSFVRKPNRGHLINIDIRRVAFAQILIAEFQRFIVRRLEIIEASLESDYITIAESIKRNCLN